MPHYAYIAVGTHLKNGNLSNLIPTSDWTACRSDYLDSSTISTLQKRKEEIICNSSFHFDSNFGLLDLGISTISTFKEFLHTRQNNGIDRKKILELGRV